MPSRASAQGYVYLPGRDGDAFRFNHAMYHGHGFEGHCLRATEAWEKFAKAADRKSESRDRNELTARR